MDSELPDGWEWKRFDEIGNIFAGSTPSTLDESNFNGDIPWVTPADLGKTKNMFIQNGQKNISEKGLKSSSIPLLPKGTILFSSRAPIGYVAIASNEITTNQGCKNLVLNAGILPEFVYFYIKKNGEYLESLGSGSTFKELSKTRFSQIIIPIPPLETQRQIVLILEKADTIRRLRAESDALTQRLLQSVFLEMFGDPVTNPMGWDKKKISEICIRHFGGGTPSKSNAEYYLGDIPWVSPKDMKKDFILDSIDHITEEAVNNSATKLVPKFSLLMVIRSAILKKYLPVAINLKPVTINQDMKAFIINTKIISPYYFLYLLKSYQSQLLQRVRSVTADNIEFDMILNSEIPTPPLNIQIKFENMVKGGKGISDCQEKNNLMSNELFDSLMAKAFTGELVT
jgi:type I restriction enzyme S subunit